MMSMTHLHARMLTLLVLLGVTQHLQAASFHVPKAYLAGGGAAVGDFNGDGKPDVAATNSNSNTVSILIGDGDGTLQDPVNYVVTTVAGAYPGAIVAGDFNGDGKLDLAVLISVYKVNGFGYSRIAVLLGNGDGTFRPPITTYLTTVD